MDSPGDQAGLEGKSAEPDVLVIVYTAVPYSRPCTWCKCIRERGQHRDCTDPCRQPAIREIEMYFAGSKIFEDEIRVCLEHLPAFHRWADIAADGRFAL